MPANKDQSQDKIDFENALIAIATSTTVSAAVDLRGMTLCGISIPAGFDGTSISFQASFDNSSFQVVKDGSGNTLSKTVAADEYIKLDPVDFCGIQYIKIVSGSAEGANRTMPLSLRQV